MSEYPPQPRHGQDAPTAVSPPEGGAVPAPQGPPGPAVPWPRSPCAPGSGPDSAEKQVWYHPETVVTAREKAPTVVPPPQQSPPEEPPQPPPPPHQWPPQPPQQWPAQPPPAQQWRAQPQAAQWAPSAPVPRVPAQPRSSTGTSTGLVVGILATVLVVVLGGAGVAFYIWQKDRSATTTALTALSPSAGPSDAGAQVGTPQTGSSDDLTEGASQAPTVSPEQLQQQALAQLDALRAASVSRLPLDGRWVAQVASKSVGISDPLQTAQNGSHTFYATDILAESMAARNTVSDPSEVYVVWGTDFGKRSQAADGSPYWVTLVDAGFSSSAGVSQWCQATFSNLTPQQLADTCAPRTLVPPHS